MSCAIVMMSFYVLLCVLFCKHCSMVAMPSSLYKYLTHALQAWLDYHHDLLKLTRSTLLQLETVECVYSIDQYIHVLYVVSSYYCLTPCTPFTLPPSVMHFLECAHACAL